MDDRSEGSLIDMDDDARHQTQRVINEPLRRQVTIDKLPDDVLLVIFDHYMAEANQVGKIEEWQTLVHVCQNWRRLVFKSPQSLNLRILYSAGTPVREMLAVWPPLPIIIEEYYSDLLSKCRQDNIIAALGHNDRIREIYLPVPGPLMERIFAAMQKTFVSLEVLWLFDEARRAPVVSDSDSFLGGSAPHLRHLYLICISFPFPVLRKLLLSAPNLVDLELDEIPYSVYNSPEVMVTCVSALTRLKTLLIKFNYPQSPPPQESRHLPPTRSVLPALTKLEFKGDNKYLEDLVARIDAPLLNRLCISFFHELIFDTPQFAQFLSRTPKLKAYDEACVILSSSSSGHSSATIVLPGRDYLGLQLRISCRWLDEQLPSLMQVCTSSFPQALIPMLEHLYILEHVYWRLDEQDYPGNDLWLEFFHPFTTVKNLYLSREFVPRIMPALQELVGERVTEVLPNLQSIFLEDSQKSGFVSEDMQQFIAARQLSNHAISISPWKRQEEWLTTEVYDLDD